MSENRPILAPQFDDLEQQHEASTPGMWIFLATEVMFFGGLFTGYTAYRFAYPNVFADASRHTNVILGGINTSVLFSSSLTITLAIHAAQEGKRKALVGFLILTILLGSVFLGIKAVEYYHEFEEHLVPGLNFSYNDSNPQKAELFFLFYFIMTGLHAVHLSIGIGIVAVIAFLAWRGHFSSEQYTGIELTGLYWHFVDIIWIFLYPLLYLIGRH